MKQYTRAKRLKGRKYFSQFEFINVISFSLLAGNVLTLLVLQLGASDVLVGILNSFIYVSFFFMPLGRKQVKKYGMVRNFGRSWIIRYSAMFPIILAPLLWGDKPYIALPLIFAGYLGFQIFRGIGIVSINPIMKELSTGKDQGNFLSRMQILVHSGSLLANIGVAVLVGADAPLWRYSVSVAIGVFLGIFGARSFMKIPEPPSPEDELSPDSPQQKRGLMTALLENSRKPLFRRFLVPYSLLIFFSSMYRPFLTVYAKQYYQLPDSTVLLFNLIGSLGAITMGFINRSMLDRMGAKPMIMIFTGVLAGSSLLAMLGSNFTGIVGLVFLSLLFYIALMGGSGAETSSQGYFYTIMPKTDQIELGILYYLIMGISGALGSVIGGGILDALKTLFPGDLQQSFFFFFLFTTLGLLGTLGFMFPMDGLEGKTVSQALSVLLSLRDWRAMSLVRKLDSTTTVHQEQALLRKLRKFGSTVTLDDVLDRLQSPLFRLRREALNTLYFLPYTTKIQQTLIDLVRNNEFATSYPAARLMGQRGDREALPVLREALNHSDELLQANAAAALGEFGDEESREAIEQLVQTTKSVSVKVYGCMALGMLGNKESIPSLFEVARHAYNENSVTQEAAFSIASILGLEQTIHRYYPEFRDNPDSGLTHLVENLGGNQSDTFLKLFQEQQPEQVVHHYFEKIPDNEFWVQAQKLLTYTELTSACAFRFLLFSLMIKGLQTAKETRE